jgi:cell division protein FtsA
MLSAEMNKQQQKLVTAIDVGSAKTCALVAEVTDSGLRYLGHGTSESRGSRKGAIVDLEKATASVQRAVEKAEAAAGVPVERALVGIGGGCVRGVNSRGGISVGSRAREITRDDVRQAVGKARSIALPPEWQIMHLLPQEFLLDDQNSIRDPAGMLGSRLEVQVHMVTAVSSATQNVVTALNRAGIHVDDTVFEPLASADCLLKGDERELGVCLADIGAGSTELIVYHEGVVVHTGVIPVGGDHFTNDVAVGLRTPLADAEKIKRSYGSAAVTRVPEDNEIEVTGVGDRPPRLMSHRFLAEILEPRAWELFEMMRDNLRQARALELCTAGMVLTGGGARLAHLLEVAETVLRKPVRLASPPPLSKMPPELTTPENSALVGLVLYGHRVRQGRVNGSEGLAAKLKAIFGRNGHH